MLTRIWILLILLLVMGPNSHAQTSTPVPEPVTEVIKRGVIKAIKAFDLMIQRLQTKTIWLQNTQKILENKLSELKLREIADWAKKQRDLYKKYYDELWQVRSAISTYYRINQIATRQKQIVEQYQFTWKMINEDSHFTSSEIDYMYRVYTGMLNESLLNLEMLLQVVKAFKIQMSDAKRLEMIDHVAESVEKNYADLNAFSRQNIQLSINRAKDLNEIELTRKLYGLN